MKITREEVEKAINKGYLFYGDFYVERAVDEIMKLLENE